MKHFASHVNSATAEKMHMLAELIESEFISEQVDAYGMHRITELPGKHVPGFIPFTGGGYIVSEYYNPWGSGKFFTQAQRDFYDDQSVQCLRAFISDKDLEIDSYDKLTDEQREQFHAYESKWFSDCDTLLVVDIWTGHSSDPEPDSVTVRLSINYLDAPYFREKHGKDIKTFVYSAEEFAALDIRDVIESLQLALDQAE